MLILILTSLFQLTFALEARWLGVAGVSLTDGESVLLFDPVVTKPTIKNWITGSELKSNEIMVKNKLHQWQISKADGIFASHTHFDHASDIGAIAKFTGARVYGGDSLKRVATHQFPFVSFVPVVHRQTVQIGSFRVTSIHRKHAPILQSIDWHFLPGPVPSEFEGGFYDFHEGDTWGFYIEHRDGNILIDQGSHFFPEYKKYAGTIKAYFVGVANKKSVNDLVQNNISVMHSPLVVPLHFDFFFLQALEEKPLPGVDLQEIKEATRQYAPSSNFLIPRSGEAIRI